MVILDSNFLMAPVNHGVDIFSEMDRIIDRDYKIAVPEVVIGELKNLKKSGTPSEKKAAKVAIELASNIERIPSKKPADEEIIRLAKQKNCLICTNDSDLRKRIREIGVPVIYLRQESHLEICGKI